MLSAAGGGGGCGGLAAEQPEKAGMGESQHQKQDNEGEQHPDDDVHLVDRQRELIVELLFRVDEIGVIVVEERFAALRSLCTGCFELGLLLFQLSFTSCQSGFPPGQLRLTGGLFFSVIVFLLPLDEVFLFGKGSSPYNLSVCFADNAGLRLPASAALSLASCWPRPTATPCFRRWRRSSPLPLVGEVARRQP